MLSKHFTRPLAICKWNIGCPGNHHKFSPYSKKKKNKQNPIRQGVFSSCKENHKQIQLHIKELTTASCKGIYSNSQFRSQLNAPPTTKYSMLLNTSLIKGSTTWWWEWWWAVKPRRKKFEATWQTRYREIHTGASSPDARYRKKESTTFFLFWSHGKPFFTGRETKL